MNNENIPNRTKFNFKLNNKLKNDVIMKEYYDAPPSTSHKMNKEINYSDFKINLGSGRTPKGKYSNVLSSRGSYNLNKSIELSSSNIVNSVGKHHINEPRSFKKYQAFEDNVKIIKTMKSISKVGSAHLLPKPLNPEPFKVASNRYEMSSRERPRNRTSKDNRINFSNENISGRDSPNKPINDSRDYYQPYKFPSAYSNSYRYRSGSRQGRLGSESCEGKRERSIEIITNNAYSNERGTQNYINNQSSNVDEVINFEK